MTEGNGEMYVKFLRKEHNDLRIFYPTNSLLIYKGNRHTSSYMRELKHIAYRKVS